MKLRHEVTINNNKFFIGRIEAFDAFELLGDLQQQFLSPILSSLENIDVANKAEVTKAFLAGIAKLSHTVNGKTLRGVAERLLNPNYIAVSIEGESDRKLDIAARNLALGSAADVMTLCIEVIKWNYADFLEPLSNLTGQGATLLAEIPSASLVRN